MRRLYYCAAKLDDTGGAGINIGHGNERLPPGWTRPRKIGGRIHHATNVFAIVLEERVDTKRTGIDLAPIPAQQPAVKVAALPLVCGYELVPEKGSMFRHIAPGLGNVARPV